MTGGIAQHSECLHSTAQHSKAQHSMGRCRASHSRFSMAPRPWLMTPSCSGDLWLQP